MSRLARGREQGACGLICCSAECSARAQGLRQLATPPRRTTHLGVSTTYTTTVGKPEANSSVISWPEADHVKISIWPGVSAIM